MKKKLVLIPLLVLALVLSFSLVSAVPVSAAGIPTIDGVIEDGEWGEPLCTTVGYTHGMLSVNVYVYATMDTLYFAFDTNDMTDERGGAGLDVLDWNIGLVGSDFAPPGLPWRYVLVTKIYPDNSWGVSWSEIDNGYYGSWGETWNPNYYSPIPEGIEMVTSFATGYRVTEFKVPMSIMFDGEHGWDGPSGGETLLLGGTFSGETFLGEDSRVIFDMLWWPQGINHGVAETYATYELPPAPERDPDKFSVFVRLGYDSTRYNSDNSLRGSIEAEGEYNGDQYMLEIPEGCVITGADGRVSWLWLKGIDGDILSFVGGRGNVEFSEPCVLYIAEGGRLYQDYWTGEWLGDGEWVEVFTFTSIKDGIAQ